MTSTDLIIRELNDQGVLRLTLNDSKHRNALSEAILDDLTSEMETSSTNSNIRTIVLAANGPAFSAGHNLKEMTAGRNAPDNGREYFTHIIKKCSTMMQSIVNNPKPVIAEVSGIATAAGCQLVASCDLVYADETAQFGTPGVNIGLFCSTPMVALSRCVANKFAMEMLLTGDMISAQRAAEIGLINQVIRKEELTQHTMNLAARLASKSSKTLAIGKKAYYAQGELNLEEAYHYASKVMAENMLIDDAKEGIQAFIEKRPAKWTDQ